MSPRAARGAGPRRAPPGTGAGPRGWAPALAGLLLGVGAGACAPTTLGPHVVRMDPGVPGKTVRSVGLRTGPRLAAQLAPRTTSSGGDFSGDANSFNLAQWGIAYDLALSRALTPQDSLHLGVQAEFAFPFPLPGYGVYAGISHLEELGALRVVPALTVHGATDLGLGVVGGPGTQGGVELSATLAFRPGPQVALALVPFAGLNGVIAGRPGPTAVARGGVYLGGVLALQLWGVTDGRPGLELTGGFGRVQASGAPSWNVPLAGVRATQ